MRLTLGAGSVDVTRLLTARPVGEWATLKVRLSCLADHGADIAAVDQPWGLRTDAPFAVTVETIRLTPNEGDAVCPTGE